MKSQDWRPIETAPMDGTPILVLVEPADFFNKNKRITSAEREDGSSEYGRWVLHVPSEYPGDNTIHPTHWMPLPEAPKE